MSSKSKFICFILSLIMIINSCVSVFAKENKNKSIEEVFYDGVKYIIETKINKTTITAEGYDARFEMKQNGQCKLKGKNVKGLEDGKEFDIIVNELNKDKIDVQVYKEGKFVETINSYDELNLQTYEGQAVTSTLLIGLYIIISVLVATAATIVIGGIVYTAIDAIVQAIKENTPNDYFLALVRNGRIYIDTVAISLAKAAARVKGSGSIYSYSGDSAYSAVLGSGLGIKGPEIDSTRYENNIYYYHYFPANRNGAHAWYGNPIYGSPSGGSF